MSPYVCVVSSGPRVTDSLKEKAHPNAIALIPGDARHPGNHGLR